MSLQKKGEDLHISRSCGRSRQSPSPPHSIVLLVRPLLHSRPNQFYREPVLHADWSGKLHCPARQSSLLRIVEHGENTPSSRSQVFCVLFCIGGGFSAEYCIREHESEGCVSLSGGAEHRLKAAVKSSAGSCKGFQHKCSSRQFGRCCVFCQIFSETASRLVCYLCRPCAEARSPRARAS